jgi:hypothetical protein
MSRDPHPAIKHQAQLDGWSQHGDFDRDAFTAYHNFSMVLHGPENRIRALNQIDQQISADDGSSLRQKSDLVRLRRELSKTHEALLKAGR